MADTATTFQERGVVAVRATDLARMCGVVAVRATDLARMYRERLARYGFLRQ